MSERLRLSYGSGHVHLDPAGGFQVVVPEELPPAGPGEIERAIDEPFGQGLESFSGSRSAAILVSDITRPSPSYLLVPPLVRRLKEIGAQDIKVFFGLGTHRRMSTDEERLLLRDSISLPHMQHDMNSCVRLGETSRGTPVEILDEVAERDLIIATGNIEYHYYAGYSGGAKALLPGVSSEASIIRNHELMREPEARSGNIESPVRQDIEEAAGVAGLDIALDVVLNSRKEIVTAVAGDYIISHRAGAKVVDRMYRKKVLPAEIVITCAGGRPKDINLFQAHKALDNALGASAPGGSIILLAECAEGFGHPVFARWIKDASSAEDCIERFSREYEFGGHKAAYIARDSLDHDLILVSSMPKEDVERCFFRPARTLEEALAMAMERQGRGGRTVVMPSGHLTLAEGQ